MDPLPWIEPMLRGGLASLGAYLAAHVLLRLIPAFFIAGALAALVPKESITRYLGCNAPKRVAYPAAAVETTIGNLREQVARPVNHPTS